MVRMEKPGQEKKRPEKQPTFRTNASAIVTFQQFRDRRDFIALRVHLALPQHQMIRRGPRADHMNRLFPDGAVVAAPHRLAINRDHLASRHPEHPFNPVHEIPLERFGIDHPKHVTKCVMGGDAVFQW